MDKPPGGMSALLGGFSYAQKGGGTMAVRCEIKNYRYLQKKMENLKKAPRKVMAGVTADAKKRVPGWVAAEVTKQYGIKKSEITGQKIGRIRTEGDNVTNVRIVYTGRVLTPTHFNMSPKAPNPGGAYTLKATIVKGQRTTLGKVKKLTKKQRAALVKNFTSSGERSSDHSPIMLMPTGSTYIPFQRKSENRKDVQAVKTLSLPQMVASKRTEEGIQKAISENLGKRLEHHMNRYMT
jgi:hypothetical protein